MRFRSASFHKQWFQDFKDLDEHKFTHLVLCDFRGSAKTTIARLRQVQHICYRTKHYINYVSQDMEGSKDALLDIAIKLQTNPLLVSDFGQLFYSDNSNKKKKQSTIKQQGNFITENGIIVKATSITGHARGKLSPEDNKRPDSWVFDDFENNRTKKSAIKTRTTINFIKEMIGGLDVNAEVIYPCNYISDTGAVAYLMDTSDNNRDWRVRLGSAVIDYDKDWTKGKPAWPEVFVMTDEEADKINSKVKDKEKRVKSLQSLARTMNADGTKTFEQEMLNQPLVEGDRFFDVDKVDARINELKNTEWQNWDIKKPHYRQKSGDWTVWGEYEEGGHYTVAADVSEGYGGDSAVVECWDLATGRQLKEFESNLCPPDVLAKHMVDEGRLADDCLLCPERNSIGVAVVNEIKGHNYINMYRETTFDKVSQRPVHKFGWHTNVKTKPLMLFEFKRDFEAGHIQIMSIPLLKEMRSYTNIEIGNIGFDDEVSNHFDRVMASCIAWQMRKANQIKGFIGGIE